MTDMTDLEGLRRQLASAIQAHWKLFLAQGILMMVLGVFAVAEPNVATVAVGIFIGWLFFIGGIFRAMSVWHSRQAPGFVWSLPDTDSPAPRGCADPDDGADSVLHRRRRRLDHRRVPASRSSAQLGLGAIQRHHRPIARLPDLGRLAKLGRLGDWPPRRHQYAVPRIVSGDDRALRAADGQPVTAPLRG